MKAMIFTAMPMFVCLFWSTMLALSFSDHDDRLGSSGTPFKRNRPRMVLLAFMLTATLLYFGHCVFFNHNADIIPLTDTIYSATNLAVYPVYYLYICSLTVRSNHNLDRWTMLIPAVIAGITVGVLYVIMTPEETQQFVDTYLYEGRHAGLKGTAAMQAYVHDACKAMFGLLIFPVFFHGRTHIMEYNRLVENVYADTDNKKLSSLHHMLVAFVITSAVSFTVNIIGRHQFDENLMMLAIPSTLFSILLFTIGYIGYRQKFSIMDIEQDEHQADNSQQELTTISELRKRIEQVMVEEQLYRQPNFKIIDLVQRLNSNRNYIYKAVNLEMGRSFSEYINRMRIEHAALLINQHPDMPLNEIAEQSGFTSSTSFYRNFKLYKKMAPKEYQQKMRKKK